MLEVSPLDAAEPFRLLSIQLQDGFGFFQPPMPPIPSAFLAVGLPPKRRDGGFSTFYSNNNE
jgi:hypothetical protein